jgi:hypothetical protein
MILNYGHLHSTMRSTLEYATTNDATTNECYNEQFVSIKSGYYDEHRCYNERGGTLSADVARSFDYSFEYLKVFMLFSCVRIFKLFTFTCAVYKS